MTEEERELMIGKLVMRSLEQKKDLALWKAQLQELGQGLAALVKEIEWRVGWNLTTGHREFEIPESLYAGNCRGDLPSRLIYLNVEINKVMKGLNETRETLRGCGIEA